jgi:hypothetical protein
VRQVKREVKSMLIILTSSWLFKNNSSWQVKESIQHTAYYAKTCEGFTLNIGNKKLAVVSWLHTVSHLFFWHTILLPKTTLLFNIWGFHSGDYEEWCLLGCYAVWLL